jgi:1,4-alpha-glucan branching enzyme
MSDASFGARAGSDGTSFRLWAPAAKRVDLVLERKPQAMRRGEDGWFSLDVS